jgi:hypothetical protein
VSLFIYVSSKRLYFICLAYLGGRRSRSALPDDLVIPVHFEVGQEFRLCFLDQLLIVLLKLPLIFSRQSFLGQLNDVAGKDVRAIF